MKKQFKITLFVSDLLATELVLLAALENGKRKGLGLMGIAIFYNMKMNKSPELNNYHLSLIESKLTLDKTDSNGNTDCLLLIEEVEINDLSLQEIEHGISESKVDEKGNIYCEPLNDHD